MPKTVLRLLLATVGTILLSINVRAADGMGKLHVLLVLDSAADGVVGPSVKIDKKNIIGFLRLGIPKERLSIKVLESGTKEDEDITNVNIRGYFAKLNIARTDTLLFYYSGHGGVNQKGHYLLTKGEDTYRSDVLAMIKNKRPHLGIVLTDCCATVERGPIPPVKTMPKSELKPLLDKLFFQHQGIVDWNACAVGETAQALKVGGAFTVAFIGQCNEIASQNETITWQELLPKVVIATKKLNRHQTPTDMALLQPPQVPLPPKNIRDIKVVTPLGAKMDPVPGVRLLAIITNVTPGGSAWRAGIKRGDQVLAIDGNNMTRRECLRFLNAGVPKTVALKIAVKCGCGCGKLHKDCGNGCAWGGGRPAAKCAGK